MCVCAVRMGAYSTQERLLTTSDTYVADSAPLSILDDMCTILLRSTYGVQGGRTSIRDLAIPRLRLGFENSFPGNDRCQG